jgi:class 3 adenylate cyclase/tetratricopeptide (TPR) repeat protein
MPQPTRSARLTCPACGARLRPAHRFCPNCGAPVSPATAQPPGSPATPRGTGLQVSPEIDIHEDRRLVSVLFADLSGSTPLGERLDPEDLRRILGAFFAALVRPIQRYEGTVEKYMGDAVMAVFGAPVSHEDDAERTVRAALEMQHALTLMNDWLEREHGLRLALRVGISSGEVVGGLLASDVQSAYTVVGDTVNTAQRLESIATPGEIVVGPTTYRLAARAFEFEPLGPKALKGKAQTVEAYRVVGSKDDAVADGSTPLIGRSAELALLRQALAGAVLGQGQALTVRGEAGVGKSRLIAEFTTSLGTGVDRWMARGRSYDRQTSYAVLASLLRSAFGIRQADEEPVARAGIERRMHELGLDLDHVTVRLLLDVLGYASAGFDPQASRRVLNEVVRNLVRLQAAAGPLLIIAEDLHWIDSASQLILADLVADLASLPCLFVGTGRSEWQPPWSAQGVELTTLDEAESRQLIVQCLGGEVEPSLLETMLLKSGGNAFFIEQLAYALRESGAIAREGGVWVGRQSLALVVPDSVHEVLGARIDGLQAGPARVVRAAAVVGRTFWYRVLERIDPSPSLAGDLDHLIDQGFVEQRGIDPEVTHAFRHALIQEVAYLKQLLSQRGRLHVRVADAIGDLFAQRADEYVDIIAYHYARGDDDAKASAALLRAGQRARRLYAIDEALAYFRSALERSAQDPAAVVGAWEGIADVEGFIGNYGEAAAAYRQALAALDPADDRGRSRLLRKLGVVHQITGDTAEALRTLTEARDVLSTGADREQALVLLELGQVHWQQGSYGQSREALLAAEQRAERAGADDARADAYKHLGTVASLSGDTGMAIDYYRRSLELYEARGDVSGQANALNNIGIVHRKEGRYPDALQAHARALAIRERIGDPLGIGTSRNNLAQIELARGALDEAQADFSAALQRWSSIGYAAGVALARTGLGITAVRRGDAQTGRRDLQRAIEEWEQLGSRTYQSETERYLAEACLSSDAAAALKWAQRAVATARAVQALEQEGIALQVLGTVHASRGETAGALGALERSREILRGTSERQELARTLAALARAYRALPPGDARRSEADQLVAEAVAIFRELGAELDLLRLAPD